MYNYQPADQDRQRGSTLSSVVNFGGAQQGDDYGDWGQQQPQQQPQAAVPVGGYGSGGASQWQQQPPQQHWQYEVPSAGAYSGQMQPGSYSGQVMQPGAHPGQMQAGAYSGQMQPGSYSGQMMQPGAFAGQMDGYAGQMGQMQGHAPGPMDGAPQAAPKTANSLTRNISATLLGEGEGDEPPILEGAPPPRAPSRRARPGRSPSPVAARGRRLARPCGLCAQSSTSTLLTS